MKFDSLINYVYSPNGTGKTNLLEAIQCISVGKSLRAKAETEIFSLESGIFNEKELVHVGGKFKNEEGLEFSQSYNLEAEPKRKKTLLINKNKISINEFIGRVPSIWFSPESIKILTTSPKNKRKYFDDILIQLYPEYLYDLRNYNRALRQRNKLLQDFNPKPNQIRVWTEELIKYGSKIIKTRQKFFEHLNGHFAELKEIERYKFKIEFKSNIEINEIFNEDAEYRFREELRKSYEMDRRKFTTTKGPHRDDWNMLIEILTTSHEPHATSNFIRADKYASRGQQRMSLIILQMVLIGMFEKNLQTKPIMLLDDIFSELDPENEKILVDFIIQNNIQSFITGVVSKDFENIREFNLSKVLG